MEHFNHYLQQEAAFERNIFKSILLTAFAAAIYSIINHYLMGHQRVVAIGQFVVLGLLFLIWAYYLVKREYHPLVIPLVALMYVSLLFFWFLIGGFLGTVPYFFQAFIVSAASIIHKPLRKNALLFICGTIVLAIVFQWIFPSAIAPPSSSAIDSIPYSILISAACITYVVYVLKRNMDRNTKVLIRTNQLILDKNQDIFQSNKALETGQKEIEQKNDLLLTQREELSAQKDILEDTIQVLKNAQDQLVQTEKMAALGVLTSGISHEIEQPINRIAVGVKALQKEIPAILAMGENAENFPLKQLEEKETRIFQVIAGVQEGTQQVAQIVKELRNFSRTDTAELVLCDLHKGLDSTLLLLKNQFGPHVQIRKNYGQLPLVECFPGRVNQVFLNLLTNALHALGGAGEVSISTGIAQRGKTWGQQHAFIRFADNGSGIPESQLPHIFQPFFTTKPPNQGSGLGLTISQKIIRELGGDIEVESQEGAGSVFTIWLPLSRGG